MSDLRTLMTVPQEISTEGSVTLRGLSVKGGIPSLDALQDSSCHLSSVLRMLGDSAIDSSAEDADALYAVITSASIAKALLDSVVAAAHQAERFAEGAR
ncbi:hypothetical protein [Paraburkholderia tropica]|uniref:hypothetical protein n=1 Tax=Paraburkholderia tropica TaxID=92647 RepID=UPI002AB05D95|nr:hypothetical protein [Paraburkholderia tropica]